MIGTKTKLLRNTEWVRIGGDLVSHVESWIETSSPRDLVGLFDQVAIRLLGEAFDRVGGCEGTIWLSDPGQNNLVAVYNSGADPDGLIGFEQPFGSGIVSMVYSQQQPYCENDIKHAVTHDDTLDRKIAKHTKSMIAVPFYFAFGLRGVISCVQLEEAEDSRKGAGFSSADVEILTLASNVVERLVDQTILASALGLSDVG